MKHAGVYQITNNVNGRFYIGSTTDLNKRWIEHKTTLNRGKHRNTQLQIDWDTFGESAFSIKLLEPITDHQSILKREDELIKHHFDDGRRCYNLVNRAVVGGGRHSPNPPSTPMERQQKRREKEKSWLKSFGYTSWEQIHTLLMDGVIDAISPSEKGKKS